MLKSFTIKNFKSFKEATLPLTPTVTFLIGANGSGKTNALEALRFSSFLGHGMTLSEIQQKMNSPYSSIRGKMSDLFRYKTSKLSLEFEVEEAKKDNCNWQITLFDPVSAAKTIPNRFDIMSEKLMLNSSVLYEYDTIDNGRVESKSEVKFLLATMPDFKQKAGVCMYNSLGKLLTELDSPEIEEKNKRILQASKAFIEIFMNMFFLDLNLAGMRNYVELGDNSRLEEDGSNLSEVLFNLCKDLKKKKSILEIIRSLPEQNISDITFLKTQDKDVRLNLIEDYDSSNTKTSAKLLSDGTLRVLAIATALYSVPKGSLLIIEEVDNGIHPSRIQHLVDKMYEIAAERKIQILVTTHDPAMMNAIPPQEKGNVLCCYRSKEDGTSKILRLSDSPHADSIIIGQKLGDFVTTEQFDSQIKDTRSAQEVHEAQMKWLEQFMQSVSNFDKEGADE